MEIKKNLRIDNLRKLSKVNKNELIPLRIEYSTKSKLLNNYIYKLINIERIYPTHLPTQASFRWSTLNPPLTNFPRKCINSECKDGDHEWTDKCWSLRDIVKADIDEVMVVWDHDNMEGRIHDLVINDEKNLEAHQKGYDLHTLTCCDMFNMDYPRNYCNPHTSKEDADWRMKNNWQGKDTKRRVLAKNFNHGSKYTRTWRFVYKIDGIEEFGLDHKTLGDLAKRYIKSKGEVWDRKIALMDKIRRDRIARTLYGGRRIFFTADEATGREGFSHMISGTASNYNDETLIKLEEYFGDDIRLIHNAHDGDKIAIKRERYESYYPNEFIDELNKIIVRPISYRDRSVTLTAGIKVYE